MSLVINGAQWNAFYNDPAIWGKNDGSIYYDDVCLIVNGEQLAEGHPHENFADSDSIKIESGVVYYPNDSRELASVIRSWLKKQTKTFLVVECDVKNLDAVKAAIKAAGGKVK